MKIVMEYSVYYGKIPLIVYEMNLYE